MPRHDFLLEFGAVIPAPEGAAEAVIRVFHDPTPQERITILDSCAIDDFQLSSALDPEEVPRVELENGRLLILWNRAMPVAITPAATGSTGTTTPVGEPATEISVRPASPTLPDQASGGTAFQDQGSRGAYDVSTIGFVLHHGILTVITSGGDPTETVFLNRRIRGSTRHPPPLLSVHDVLLRELADSVRDYLEHLRVIKSSTRGIQAQLKQSISNEHYLRMFELGEGLVYFINAIEGNTVAAQRLRTLAERVSFPVASLEVLDDVVLENQQCARQARIYSEVLAGLMDARGNIVNNNMNMYLKNLTIINVVFLPVTLVTGLGGMSEYATWTGGIEWYYSFSLMTVGMILLGLVTWKLLGCVAPD